MDEVIHLDTNYLIHFASARSPEVTGRVLKWIDRGIPIHVSAMAWAEFRCGPLSDEESDLMAGTLSGIIPVSHELADLGGRLFNDTGRRSRSLPDCLIAATAIMSGARLATGNRKDFEPFLRYGMELV